MTDTGIATEEVATEQATPEQEAALKKAWEDLCRRREAGIVLPGVSSEELRERARLVRLQRNGAPH